MANMKKVIIGIAAAGLALAGCSSATASEPAPSSTTQTAAAIDPSVSEWHRIANKYESKISGNCMANGDGILVNVCLGLTGASMDTLEKSVERQPKGPYRTEVLDSIDNYQLTRERYKSTEAWCDGGNVLTKPSCTLLAKTMDTYAGDINTLLQQMLDSR